jgi:hypothetical protein
MTPAPGLPEDDENEEWRSRLRTRQRSGDAVLP